LNRQEQASAPRGKRKIVRIIHYPTTNLIIYGSPRGCFGNALEYVEELDDGDMRYCEGICYDPAQGIAFHHAWAVDVVKKQNNEVSPLHGDELYFGCIVGRPRLRSRSSADGTVGPFFTFRELGPIKERIRRLHPGVKFYRATRDGDPCLCGSGKKCENRKICVWIR
jgi:hypothetical protein